MLALAEKLVDRGNEVTWLGQPSICQRATDVGCHFVAFDGVGDYQAGQLIEEQFEITMPILTGQAVGAQLRDVAADQASDLHVLDANLTGAMAAAESLAQPSVVLLHSMYKTFVDENGCPTTEPTR